MFANTADGFLWGAVFLRLVGAKRGRVRGLGCSFSLNANPLTQAASCLTAESKKREYAVQVRQAPGGSRAAEFASRTRPPEAKPSPDKRPKSAPVFIFKENEHPAPSVL